MLTPCSFAPLLLACTIFALSLHGCFSQGTQDVFSSAGDYFDEPDFVEAAGRGCATKRLFCPDECDLVYDDHGCPKNCNCRHKARCPRVKCPMPAPECLVLTQRDGCQTCGCRDPVVIIEDDDGDEEVYFVRLTYQPPEVLTGEESGLSFEEDEDKKATADVETFNPNRGDHQRLVAEAITRSDGKPTFIQLNGRTYKIQTRPVYPNRKVPVSPGNECIPSERNSIDRIFRPVLRFVKENRNPANNPTLVFPISYRHSQAQIRQNCRQYRRAVEAVPMKTLHKCQTQHRKLGEAIAILDYPCTTKTSPAFNRYYECVRGAGKNETLQLCQQTARAQLADPFLDHCDVYNILTECIFNPITYLCGRAAWEVEFQYMSLNVRQKFPHCRLETLGADGTVKYTSAKLKGTVRT